MQALLVIDVQNEFSPGGKRPVPDHATILEAISRQVQQARAAHQPIAWIRHHNRPTESPAFIPGTWGAEFSPGFGPEPGVEWEKGFQKDVYGAFTGSDIGSWLSGIGVSKVLIVGFYTHGCVSTTAREAIMAGLEVAIDPQATGSVEIIHTTLGRISPDESRRNALLHLAEMGVIIVP